MTRIGRWMAAGAAAVLAAVPAQAQGDPADVVQSYFQHLREGEIEQVAAMTHPAALERFMSSVTQLMESAGDDAPMGAAALRMLPPEAAYVMFMTGAQEGMGNELGGLTEMMQDLEVRPLGTVTDGDRAHVVYEASIGFMGTRVTETLAMSLRREGGRWLVDPSGGMLGMMGGGLMYLFMSAAMQSGMTGGFGGFGEDADSDVDFDEIEDEDFDDEEEDEDDEDWDDDEDDEEDEDEDDDDDEDEDEDEDDDP